VVQTSPAKDRGSKLRTASLVDLLPETRKYRVYGLKEKSLEKIIGRALALPQSRRIDLERWRRPGAGGLGDCVERVLRPAVSNMF
jgi:hypothetical protein